MVCRIDLEPLAPRSAPGTRPTVFGLGPEELHDRFWESHGIQPLRPGEKAPLRSRAGFFLLTPPQVLALFARRGLVNRLRRVEARTLTVEVCGAREPRYRELALLDEDRSLVRFQRFYDPPEPPGMRLVLTLDPDLVHRWRQSGDMAEAEEQLARRFGGREPPAVPVSGRVYDRRRDQEVAAFTHDLVRYWRRPDAVVPQVRQAAREVWAHTAAQVDRRARFAGPVWIGAGRELAPESTVVGPAVLWDDPAARPQPEPARRRRLGRSYRPADPASPGPSHARPKGYPGKRLLDVVLSLVGLALSLPLYPLIMLAILVEDGWPCFFAHRRESFRGRPFWCYKFRTMRRNAEALKKELLEKNQADGPQFFMPRDPRLLKVGDLLRRTKLDELPQFFNVLLGQMSVVGPRPSPREENQFCPAWREARLSVRPGITGLWQVSRTRREGCDFQEWIKYDIEYADRVSLRLDLWILWRTAFAVLRGR